MDSGRVNTVLLGAITVLLLVIVIQNWTIAEAANRQPSGLDAYQPARDLSTPQPVRFDEPIEVVVVGPLSDCGSLLNQYDCIPVDLDDEVVIEVWGSVGIEGSVEIIDPIYVEILE